MYKLYIPKKKPNGITYHVLVNVRLTGNSKKANVYKLPYIRLLTEYLKKKPIYDKEVLTIHVKDFLEWLVKQHV